MNYSISIVILNYLNYEDSIECIESIIHMKYEVDKIVLVDNGSNNGAYDILKNKYKGNEKVLVLAAGKNLGYAKGNNVGIDYIKTYVKSDFIMIVNNDTIFYDKNMLNILLARYQKGIGMIGPKIIGKDGKNQNPVLTRVNKKKIQKDINIMMNKSNLNSRKEKFILIFIKDIIKKILYHDIILHGSCFVLTPDYFEYYKHLYPKTFLYYEENILKLLLNKVKLKVKYVNRTKIYHKEDQASNLAFENDSIVMNQYALESARLCLNLYDKSYKEIIKKDFD